MGSSPVAVLAIIGIYVAFYAVFMSTEADAMGLDQAPAPEEPDSGFFDILAGVIHAIFGFVALLFGAITFNVEGAPIYIQLPIAIVIIASLGWSIATLIRGGAG